MKRYKCIACEVLARPLYHFAAHSRNVIDVSLLRRALHNDPAHLADRLQTAIDSADQEGYDAILLGYGLCGKSVERLEARTTPVVIPRAHDCITLFLGSRARYQEEFEKEPGTFWYVREYLERADGGSALALGAGSEAEMKATYEEYVQRYGEDNALYLMEVMGAWQQHYRRAALVDLDLGDVSSVEKQARSEAESRSWVFEKIAGELGLIERLVEGRWDDDFLYVEPGQRIRMAGPEEVIRVEKPAESGPVES